MSGFSHLRSFLGFLVRFGCRLSSRNVFFREKYVHRIGRPHVVGGRIYDFNSYLEPFGRKWRIYSKIVSFEQYERFFQGQNMFMKSADPKLWGVVFMTLIRISNRLAENGVFIVKLCRLSNMNGFFRDKICS